MDLFQRADDERLRAAGWWPAIGCAPGWWRGPDGQLATLQEALAQVEKAAPPVKGEE